MTTAEEHLPPERLAVLRKLQLKEMPTNPDLYRKMEQAIERFPAEASLLREHNLLQAFTVEATAQATNHYLNLIETGTDPLQAWELASQQLTQELRGWELEEDNS